MTNLNTVEASSGGLPRLVLPDLLWTGGCLPLEYRGEVVHGHMGVFLVRGSEKTILIDSGNPLHWEQIRSAVEEFLGDRPLDYVFLTHGEFPHAGLMTQWLEKYPHAIAVGDLPEYPLLYPELAHRIKQVKAGDSLGLGDRSIFFLPAVWRDLETLWAFDNKDRVLFVSDAFGYLHCHKDGECDRMSSEMPPPDAVMMQFVNERALYWTNHTDVELTFADLDEILQRLKPRLIAPAHGGIVDNAEVTTDLFKEGMKTMSASGRSADGPSSTRSAARVRSPSLVEIIPGTLHALGGSVLASRSLPWTAPVLEGWMPFQCYAFKSGGKVLLIDGGLAVHRRKIFDALSCLLDGDTNLSMMITRRDIDSINNIPALLRSFDIDLIRFPNADFTPLDFFTAFDEANAKAQAYSVASPSPVEWTPPGQVIEFGELRMEYLRTRIRVLSTNWLYESQTRTLFCSDSFGFLVSDSPGGPRVVTPGPDSFSTQSIVDFLNCKFDWLCGCDAGPIVEELEQLIADRPIDRLCPSYGCIIEGREAVALVLDRTIEALKILSALPKPSVLKDFDWSRYPGDAIAQESA